MGKISEFEQRQLASSVVGTPGVDTSTSQLFTGISQAASGAAGQVAKTIQVRQAQQKAIEKIQKAALDAAEVSTHAMKLDGDIDDLQNQIRTDSIQNPEGAKGIFTERGGEAIEDYLEENGITDPILAAKIKKAGNGSIRESSGILSNWARTQRTVNVQADFDETLVQSSRKMANAESLVDLELQIQKVDEYTAQQELLIGPQARGKSRDAIEDGVKNWLARLTRKNPEDAEKIIDKGLLNAFIDEKELGPLYNKAKLDIKREKAVLEKEQEFKVAVAENDIIAEANLNDSNGELTNVDLQSLQKEAVDRNAPLATRRALDALEVKKAKKEKAKLTKEEKKKQDKIISDAKSTLAVRLGGAQQRYVTGAKGYKKRRVPKEEMAKLLMEYHAALVEAHAFSALGKGDTNDKRYGVELEKISRLMEDLSQSSKGIRFDLGAFIFGGHEKAENSTPNIETYNRIRLDVEATFLTGLKRYEKDVGRRATVREMDAIFKASVNDEATAFNKGSDQ